MAKATTAKAPKAKKKATKPAKAVALQAKPDSSKKGGKKKSKSKEGLDALWKLAEHPLVGELLAIGATAAVAALAEDSISKKKHGGTKAAKSAGKAAAAAIGARLISEFADVKKSSTPSTT